MSRNVSLIVGMGLAVALSIPLNSANAQLVPPPGQGEPKPDDKKAKQKAIEGQPPARGAPQGQPPAPAPGRGSGDRPRADTERQGPRPGPQRPPEAPPRVQQQRPPEPPRVQQQRPPEPPRVEQQRPPEPPRVQQQRPPEAPRVQQQRPPEPPSRAQQIPPGPPSTEGLPKTTTVPQLKQRPDQAPALSPQASPALPKGVNERVRPGQPGPVEQKSPVAAPQVPPAPAGAPRGAPNGAPTQAAPIVPNTPVATPQVPPGAPGGPRVNNRVAPDQKAPPQGATEGVPPRLTAPGAPGTAAPTTAQPGSPATVTPQAATAPPSAASRIPTAVLPAAPRREGSGGFRPGFAPAGPPVQSLSEIQQGRTQRVEAGGRRTVIQENDNRIIIKQDNRTIIRHDETQRFARNATDVRSQRRPDGTTQTVIIRPGGVQLYSIVDNSGRIVRRYRRDDRGREVNIIDNRRFYRNAGIGLGVGLAIGAVALALRPPEVRIDRSKYIVDYERASDDDIYEALSAAPIERLERRYSLDEIRFSGELRDRMRRVDLDTITFEFGSWDVGQEQFPKLERVAKVISRITAERPDEVFLIEGHTDAVGSDVDNLTLSDRRAQAVAEILSSAFDVPPENLVTQGYGEQHLKIPTEEAERQNRRVAVRRITPLMSESNQ